MLKTLLSQKPMTKKISARGFGYALISIALCVSIIISAVSFSLPVIALTIPEVSSDTAVSDAGLQRVGDADDGYIVKADDEALTDTRSRKTAELAATGATGAADKRLYTDRSGDIGVSSEGYTDAAANVNIHHPEYTLDERVNIGTITSNSMERTGGTLFLEKERYAGGTAFLYYNNEQAWDGKAPIRVTGEGHNINVQAVENDFMLENDYGEGTNKVYHPNFPIKFDHINYRSQLISQNFWARGNKMVFGEGFETVDNSLVGDPPVFRIFGGAEHQSVFDTAPKTIYPTNLVIESGYWYEVYGGGRANTAYGTNVTVRGDADIAYLAGGGDDECQIAVYDQDDAHGDSALKGVGVNVYVESGAVTTLYGGSRVHHSAATIPLFDNTNLNVYTPVTVNISGGHVSNVYGMSDFTALSGITNSNTSVIRASYIHADSIVNISAADSADNVVGDLYRNLPVNAENRRHVLGTTRANITASNAFDRLNYFDVINISGSGVVVSSDEVIGGAMTDDSITSYGPSFDGYVGQIAVTNGAKLVLDNRGIINNYYNNPHENNSRYQETDRVISANGYDDPYYLSHSFVGESSEARRSLSTVSINGTTAGITRASASSFSDATGVCGLRIHGTVQGALGTSSSYNDTVPGYSTLEVTGEPIYSDADDYYYYIVADSSANGGKAFREPDGADYIVCYRLLDNGTKIGWYLRERPEITVANKLVRAGDSTDSAMVMSVTMNTFGCEWNSAEALNNVDFQIDKVTGTAAGSLSAVADDITLAAMAGIKTDSSGRFSNVITATDGGVEYLVAFDYVIDSTTPVDPTYYTVEADCHILRDNVGYADVNNGSDDIHTVQIADAARCVYDFAGNDEFHANGGYDDSIMTTFPYGSSPAGDDTALLRVYLPYGVTGALAVAENDGHFRFTTASSIDAQLNSSTAVTSDYTTANAATANSRFGITIGGDDLSDGVSKTLSAAVSEYICAVYSYKALSSYDISQQNANGLQLGITVSGLTKDGNTVGTGDPTAVNNGELQIQTAGTYKITYRFNTRTQGAQVFVVKGNLGDATVDAGGQLTDAFVLSKAPYESNHGENLNWNAANITRSYVNGVLSAELTATQSAKQVSLNYRLTADGPYTNSALVNIGANRDTSADVAALTIDDASFKYWEIRKSASSTAPVFARCYDAEFSYCIMDDYWIAPVFESDSGDKTARLNPDALKNGDEKWLAWTFGDDVDGHLVYPSDDLTFNGLSDKVIFVRVPASNPVLGDSWSNVWNRTDELSTEGYDGKTFVLTSFATTYGDIRMFGYWSDTITLTHTEYTRNRWTDGEGNLTANGRSDYLYSDFEIAFRDGAPREIYGSDSYRAGIVFELCGSLGAGVSFTPDAYTYRSDTTNLKAAIVSRASSYTTDGSTRRIQCSDIQNGSLTNMNRIELAKSYYNTSTNANAIMKVTAYLVDGEDNVTLSNPVYICLRDISLTDLAVNIAG